MAVRKSTIWTGSGDWVATKRVRCPSCGGAPERYVELGTQTLSFEARLGQRAEEGFHNSGDILSVSAVCACGHRWKLRGVRQITDLDERQKRGP